MVGALAARHPRSRRGTRICNLRSGPTYGSRFPVQFETVEITHELCLGSCLHPLLDEPRRLSNPFLLLAQLGQSLIDGAGEEIVGGMRVQCLKELSFDD